jgi:ferrous iron transport protein B
MPTFKAIWFHMRERISSFVRKATTVVLTASVVIWLLMAIPVRGPSGSGFAQTDLHSSAFAAVAEMIAPVLSPLGFGSWESSGALMTGLVAKEVVVSTLAQVHNVNYIRDGTAPTTFFEDLGYILTSFIGATVDTIKSLPLIVGINLLGEEDQPQPTQLMDHVRDNFEETSGGHGALAAAAFMVFVLLYTPCVVATSAGRQELGPKWLAFSVFGQLALAWASAFIVFQGGKLLGLG